MDEHKGLPWRAPTDVEADSGYEAWIVTDETRPDDIVADVFLDADAEYIVRAANAHDALVGACETALGWLPTEEDAAGAQLVAVRKIKAALRLARGGDA